MLTQVRKLRSGRTSGTTKDNTSVEMVDHEVVTSDEIARQMAKPLNTTENPTPEGSDTEEPTPGGSKRRKLTEGVETLTEDGTTDKNATSSGSEEQDTAVNMILDGVTDFSELLQEKNYENNNKVCFLWRDAPSSSSHQMFSKLWEEEFLTDLTLLVGSVQVPIKVHKVILAANFEYFRSMFSTGLKESALTEVYLPFVGSEDLRLLLRYAYSGEENLRKENVFQIVTLASYFGCEKLLNKCCEFIKTY